MPPTTHTLIAPFSPLSRARFHAGLPRRPDDAVHRHGHDVHHDRHGLPRRPGLFSRGRRHPHDGARRRPDRRDRADHDRTDRRRPERWAGAGHRRRDQRLGRGENPRDGGLQRDRVGGPQPPRRPHVDRPHDLVHPGRPGRGLDPPSGGQPHHHPGQHVQCGVQNLVAVSNRVLAQHGGDDQRDPPGDQHAGECE